MGRLKAGFLLREILNRSREKSEGAKSLPQKFWMYSAHDVTVANVLNTLGLFEVSHRPGGFSSQIQVWQRNRRHHYVNSIESQSLIHLCLVVFDCPLA